MCTLHYSMLYQEAYNVHFNEFSCVCKFVVVLYLYIMYYTLLHVHVYYMYMCMFTCTCIMYMCMYYMYMFYTCITCTCISVEFGSVTHNVSLLSSCLGVNNESMQESSIHNVFVHPHMFMLNTKKNFKTCRDIKTKKAQKQDWDGNLATKLN